MSSHSGRVIMQFRSLYEVWVFFLYSYRWKKGGSAEPPCLPSEQSTLT